MYDRASLYNRMYHQAYIIDDFMYILGGQTNGGKIMDEFIEINLQDYAFNKLELDGMS